jgi:succinoglycan biosynthesis transport protein ExoP
MDDVKKNALQPLEDLSLIRDGFEGSGSIEPVTFRDFLEMAYRRKFLIGIFFIIYAAIVVVSLHFMPVAYRASSFLFVNLSSRSLMPSDYPPTVSADWIQAEAQIIKSYPVLEDAVIALNLHPYDLRQKSIFDFIKNKGKSTISQSTESTIRLLEKSVNVKAFSQSNLIQVSVDAKDPKLAADISNTLVRLYKEKYSQPDSDQVSKNFQFVSQQTQLAKDELNNAENSLKRFIAAERIVPSEEELKATTTRITALREEFSDVNAKLNTLAEAKAGVYDFDIFSAVLPEIKSDAYITALRSRLAALEIERSQNMTRYAPASTVLSQVEEEIGGVNQNIKDAVLRIAQAAQKQLELRRSALVDLIKSSESTISTLSDKSIIATRLKEEVENKRANYLSLTKKLDDFSLWQAMNKNGISNTKIINVSSLAKPPLAPITARWGTNTILGLLAAFLLASITVLLIEYWDDTIKDSKGLKRYLSITALGDIPLFKTNGSYHNGMLAHDSFRNLSANINMILKDGKTKSILVTSLHSEGKTTVALQLAVASAIINNKKVLLVDANLHNPAIHYLLNIENRFGLSEALSNGSKADGYIQHTRIDNLKVMTSGKLTSTDPLCLFESSKLESFLNNLRAQFDLVIVDSPSLSKHPDGLVLSSKLDATLLLVEALQTRYAAARYAYDIVCKNSNNFLGVILNKRRYFIPENVYQKL